MKPKINILNSHFRHFNDNERGFSLVELIVSITIISILSTMSVMGYRGFVRAAHDAQRMDDIATLNSIVMDYRRSTGKYPTIGTEFETSIMLANNGNMILDPLNQQASCLTSPTDTTRDYCGYLYYTCDNNTGYALSVKFETSYNAQKYTKISNDSAWYYNTGTCLTLDLPLPESVPAPQTCRNKDECIEESVCVGPPPKHCRAKNSQTAGSECDENSDCLSNNCNTNAHKCKS